MSEEVKIRRADINDVVALSVLFDHYRVFYEKQSDVNGARNFLTQRLINAESVIFLAIKNGVLIGFTQLYPLFSSTRMQNLWLLNDLYVGEESRGKGISKALINSAKQMAIETRSCGILLETAKTNMIGNHLYPQCGFVLENHSNFYFWTNQ